MECSEVWSTGAQRRSKLPSLLRVLPLLGLRPLSVPLDHFLGLASDTLAASSQSDLAGGSQDHDGVESRLQLVIAEGRWGGRHGAWCSYWT